MVGKNRPNKKTYMGIIDVRDVALAHVKAITVDEAKGHRIITQNDSFWRNEMAQILHKEFAADGWPICIEEGPAEGDTKSKTDTTPANDILGISWTPIESTLIDMAKAAIESGV